MAESKKVVSIRLRPSLIERLDAAAEARGVKRNELVERAIERELAPAAKTRAKELGAAVRAPAPRDGAVRPPGAGPSEDRKRLMRERQERLNRERGKK